MTNDVLVQQLHEVIVDGKRLGRHVEHDVRSLEYPVEEAVHLHQLHSVEWTRRVPIFDQGDLGSCTGNAMAGALATDDAKRQGETGLDEAFAVKLYELATTLDNVPGAYPPDDTGSSGLAVAKAAKKLGKLAGYRHAFSLNGTLTALQKGPVIIGISWLTGCDNPDKTGLIQYKGYSRGGHELCVVGMDATRKLLKIANSWGTSWGADGYCYMTWDDFTQALRQGGDVVVPTYE